MKKILIAAFVFAALAPFAAGASTTNGTITAGSGYAWGENLGWINFGCDNCAVSITDSLVEGHAWSRAYGWINLSPENGGVVNDGEGNLSGYAWSSALGWINFSGATIDASGVFAGMAGIEGSNAGRINFACDNCDVSTDWRPAAVRSQAGGSAGVIYAVTTTTIIPTSTEESPTSTEGYLYWFENIVKRADIVRDGIIDVLDFNTLMVHWGETGADNPADIDGDKEVGIKDFNLLMVHWDKQYALT